MYDILCNLKHTQKKVNESRVPGIFNSEIYHQPIKFPAVGIFIIKEKSITYNNILCFHRSQSLSLSLPLSCNNLCW